MSFPASSPPGDPPQAAAWLGQCGIYLLIMVLEKGVISLVLLVPGWSKVSKPYGCLCRVQVTLWKKNLTDWRSYCLSFQNCVTCASAEPVTKLNSMWPVHDDVSTNSSHLTLTETEVFSPFFSNGTFWPGQPDSMKKSFDFKNPLSFLFWPCLSFLWQQRGMKVIQSRDRINKSRIKNDLSFVSNGNMVNVFEGQFVCMTPGFIFVYSN